MAETSHLNDAELRAVAWYAFLPERRDASLSEKTRGDLIKEISKPSNFYHWEFLNLWLREPDVAMRLLSGIRGLQKHPETMQVVSDFLEYGAELPSKGDKAANARRERVKKARKSTRPNERIRAAVNYKSMWERRSPPDGFAGHLGGLYARRTHGICVCFRRPSRGPVRAG